MTATLHPKAAAAENTNVVDSEEARRLLDAEAPAELLSRVTPEEMGIAWCRYAARAVGMEKHPDWTDDEDGWAAELYFEDQFTENEEFVRGFLATIADAASDDVLDWVGAGPIEDFLTNDPDRLAWVEGQAARSERFRVALGHVWIRSWASAETIERVENAAGTTVG